MVYLFFLYIDFIVAEEVLHFVECQPLIIQNVILSVTFQISGCLWVIPSDLAKCPVWVLSLFLHFINS